jgi:hypothetical protein
VVVLGEVADDPAQLLYVSGLELGVVGLPAGDAADDVRDRDRRSVRA